MSDNTPINNYAVTQEQARHDEYLARLADEIEAGKTMSLRDLRERRIERPEVVEYKARMVSGDSGCRTHEAWLDRLMTRFAPRRCCLSLGAGKGRIERHFVELGLCERFEALDVCFKKNDDAQIGSTGLSSHFMDLNFAKLRSGSYDFILCHGVLHHLINLEFILDQINAALKPDGVFLIYEYIGERQWQFFDERIAMLRRRFPAVRFTSVPRWAVAGFESIRSDELLRLVESVFGSSTLHSSFFGGIYFPFLTCTAAKYDHLLHEVVEFDEEISLSGEISPCYHVGVYGKTKNQAPRATAWSDEMLAQRLHRNFPPSEKLLRAIRRSPLGPVLRKVKRAVT